MRTKLEFDDALGDEQGDEAFLPVVVAAFDLAFGPGCGGIEEFDPGLTPSTSVSVRRNPTK